MTPLKIECTLNTSNKIITFSENRSRLVLINSSQTNVQKVVIDGCQITEGIRCDHFLIKDEIEYYIELKGQDIEHAINQILATIGVISSNPQQAIKIGFVICTRSPLSSAQIQNFQAKLKRSHNMRLIVKSSGFQYSI